MDKEIEYIHICTYIYMHTYSTYIYTTDYYSGIRKKKSCHLWQHGHWGHYATSVREKQILYDLPCMWNLKKNHILQVKQWWKGGGNREMLAKG